MTVETQTTKVTANGNGTATSFSFSPLVIFDSGDLQVTKVGTDGSETLLSEGTGTSDYSVSVSSYPGTGSITFPASGSTKLASGESLVMKRVLTIEQTTDLDNQGGYFADTQETALDKLTMIDLQQQEEIDRALKIPVSDSGITVELPPAADRAGLNLIFDADGNITAGAGAADANVSAAMIPVVEAATLADARSEFGATTVGEAVFTAADAAAARTATDAQQKVSSLTEDTSPDLTADYVLTRDTSAGADKKVLASRINGVINRTGTQAEVVNTTTATSLYSATIPANALSTNRKVVLDFEGDYLNNSGGAANLNVDILFGGVAVLGTAALSQASNANRRSLKLRCEIVAKGATNSQFMFAQLWLGAAGGDTGGLNTPASALQQGTAISTDTTADQTVAIRITHGTASASISARLHHAQVRLD